MNGFDRFKRHQEDSIRRSADAAPHEPKDAGMARIEKLVDPKDWREVQDLQARKRELVSELLAWRKKFWADREGGQESNLEEAATHSLHRAEDGAFWTESGSKRIKLTEGEVFAASEWGIWWKFDDSLASSEQRDIMAHQIEAKIASLYDEQLMAIGETNSLYDDMKRDAYMRKRMGEKSLDTLPNGILAEKLLFSFLTKEMHDGSLGFTVAKADAYEDIEHKIDFVVSYQGRHKGVRAEEPEEHRVGVQFTIDPTARERKIVQLERVKSQMRSVPVDSIVLVTLPLAHVRDVFNKWRYSADRKRLEGNELDPRGPDQFWGADLKKQIVDTLVREVGIR